MPQKGRPPPTHHSAAIDHLETDPIKVANQFINGAMPQNRLYILRTLLLGPFSLPPWLPFASFEALAPCQDPDGGTPAYLQAHHDSGTPCQWR